jgi:uncharacterized membrane protein
MTPTVQPFAEWCAGLIEVVGIGVIVVFGLYALGFAVTRVVRRDGSEDTFLQTRQRLGRGILLGLEFLVAADIIHTVAVELSFTTVGVLAIIVLIRTFLSFTLEVELTGHWPWQQRPQADM